jgi:Methyltransferase domain
MISDTDIKRQVREFYDQVGWQEVSDGCFQNAVFEDLRPVTHEYIHKCHLRVLRHLKPEGRYLLDAGSGPIQYPEYLEYSKGYQQRVCADISMVALQEARKRIGSRGLFVVCDIANLPFKSEAFDGLVSLHTIHHLPAEEHVQAYQELYRTLALSGKGVIVNGWDNPPLTVFLDFWVRRVEGLYAIFHPQPNRAGQGQTPKLTPDNPQARSTYVRKLNAAWLESEIRTRMPVSIWCWRSVSVHFLRTFIHERFAGKALLKLLFWLEERFPHFFGKYGQYPLIVIYKNT